MVLAEFSKIPGLTSTKPEGTFYIFPDISLAKRSSTDFAHFLLEEARVIVTPGIGFGQSFDTHVRISFTRKEAEIHEGLQRMKQACAKLYDPSAS